MDELYQGLYDLLATDDLHQQVDDSLLEATFEKISEANLPERLATALAERLVQSLNGIKASKSNSKAAEQVAWVNQVLASLQQPPIPGNTISSPPPKPCVRFTPRSLSLNSCPSAWPSPGCSPRAKIPQRCCTNCRPN
jgi:hypothetical protein